MLEPLRLRLAGAHALFPLALLGALCGILAGAVMLMFRLLIESAQSAFLPTGQPEHYEALGWAGRLLLPLAGGLGVGALFHIVGQGTVQTGVVHVMERLAYHQGCLPLRNAVMQFLGAVLCLITGQSLGREGPAVHLGAASGSLMAQRLSLSSNSIRTLVACGTAAAIAASFNTPMAGVVFAMEVVILEYTIAGFTPVILAAVVGAVLTRAVYGPAPAFPVPSMSAGALAELPYLLVLGVVMGALGAAFIHLTQRFAKLGEAHPYWRRGMLAGLLTGVLALSVPEVMGIGYDSVGDALQGRLGSGVLIGIVLAKLLATTVAIGFGLPAGLIGPTLVIGAAAGGAMGLLAQWWFPGAVASHPFYALMGMGAMMAATLQAPLAALMAMLELTADPHIILPGMLAVVTSTMIASEVFRKGSVFVTLLRVKGLDYRYDPLAQALRRVGVASLVDRRFVSGPRRLTAEEAEALLKSSPRWIVVKDGREPRALLAAADLARQLAQGAHAVDLMELPGERLQLAPIDLRSSLQEALETLERYGAEALYVIKAAAQGRSRIYGVLTRQDVEASYRLGD